MQKMKILMSSVLAVAAMLSAGSVIAAVAAGSVEQYYASPTTTYIYVSPSNNLAVPSYVYYCGTADAELARAIVASVHKNVYVGCSAASWPTTGSYRYGGTLNYIYAN